MKNKFLLLTTILLLLFIILVPNQSVHASDSCTGGQNCWDKDPADTLKDGYYCSSDAYTTVYGSGLQKSATNGTVRLEVRYSSRCTANWSRGTIISSNSNTKQLGTMADPANSGDYCTDYFHNNGNVLSAWTLKYTWMVDGSDAVEGTAGINSSVCYGIQDDQFRYTGFPCNYNPKSEYTAD